MKFISVDELMKRINMAGTNKFGMLDEDIRKFIGSMPTVEAVPIVRKSVKGYEGLYEVDNLGRVFSIGREIVVKDGNRTYTKPIREAKLKQSMHSQGYKTVTLSKDGKAKRIYVHRIVAEAFIENPNGYEIINHIDEDRTNNLPENLEWCTMQYNLSFRNAMERRKRNQKRYYKKYWAMKELKEKEGTRV